MTFSACHKAGWWSWWRDQLLRNPRLMMLHNGFVDARHNSLNVDFIFGRECVDFARRARKANVKHALCAADPENRAENHHPRYHINTNRRGGVFLYWHEGGEQNHQTNNEKQDRLYKSRWREQHFDRGDVSQRIGCSPDNHPHIRHDNGIVRIDRFFIRRSEKRRRHRPLLRCAAPRAGNRLRADSFVTFSTFNQRHNPISCRMPVKKWPSVKKSQSCRAQFLKITIGIYAAFLIVGFEIGNCTASRHCITSSTFSRW